jgi:hypothetical protein
MGTRGGTHFKSVPCENRYYQVKLAANGRRQDVQLRIRYTEGNSTLFIVIGIVLFALFVIYYF